MQPITEQLMQRALAALKAAAPQAEIILFGSRARGDARADSDVDFLIVEPQVTARRRETVRLKDALRPLRISADVVVVSRKNFEAWSAIPGTLIFDAVHHGKVLYAA